MPTYGHTRKRKKRRREWSGASWARHHTNRRDALSQRFGGIDRDIERAFLNLPEQKRTELFARYGEVFGSSAKSYAKSTYAKWQSGSVTMSGQTAERLLELLPPLLSFDVRYQLIRKLRTHFIKPVHVDVTTTVSSWRDVVFPAVEQIVERTRYANLPAMVLSGVTWLSSEDGSLAQELLRSVEEEEARVRTSYLEAEFINIEMTLMALEGKRVDIRHTISIPNGVISLVIRPSSARLSPKPLKLTGGREMDNKPNGDGLIEVSNRDLTVARRRENLLDISADSLTDEERAAVRARALGEKLNLDVAAREADDKFFSASRDMAGTIRASQELDRGQGDYTINSTHETPSGRTSININRTPSRNNVYIWVSMAVVLVIVALVLFR